MQTPHRELRSALRFVGVQMETNKILAGNGNIHFYK